jgi:imidazole glycerol phosphate synthase glutamine amidotransferase subunit
MIEIINTGVANIRSLQAAFDRLDAQWNLTDDASLIESASHVVLPGVGAYSAAVQQVDQRGLRSSIVERINSGRPTLCICLGMQMLGESSEESPGVKGLGVLPCEIKKFGDDVKVPQLGWNTVTPNDVSAKLFYESGEAYFANSFRLGEPPDAASGWNYATTDYDGSFVSSVWKDGVLACQFHPELSGPWGQQLLKNWINGGLS